MAYRTVSDSSLTAVADAIREKSGTSESLEFPEGFINAINNISVGNDALNGYLYYYGIENNDMCGGLMTTATSTNVSLTDDHIYMYVTYSSANVPFYVNTAEMIDLQNYSTLSIKVSEIPEDGNGAGIGHLIFGISSVQDPEESNIYDFSDANAVGTFSVDLSNVTESCYIFLRYQSESFMPTFRKIVSIKLE